ncbi:hypothetical protein X963_5661 [Burkholderia pseudomallei MSHR7498]|nr:hypothetical protein X963_5661 [Burkholderia pseudomallei MSHR7498]
MTDLTTTHLRRGESWLKTSVPVARKMMQQMPND